MAQCKITMVVENDEEVSITFDDTNYLIDKRLNPAIVSSDGDTYNDQLRYNLYIEEPLGKTVLSTFFEDLFADRKIITLRSFKSVEVKNLETNKSFTSEDFYLNNFGIMYHIVDRGDHNNIPSNCIINFTFEAKEEVNNG